MGWRRLVSFSSAEGQVAGSCHHCNGLRTPEDGSGMFLRNVANHLHWDDSFASQTPGIHGNEPSGSIKCGTFLTSWGTTSFLRRTPFNMLVILEYSDSTLTSQFYIYNTTCYLPTTVTRLPSTTRRLLPVICRPRITAVMMRAGDACVELWNDSKSTADCRCIFFCRGGVGCGWAVGSNGFG